jgi:hypothetical protein
VVFVTEL